MIDREVWRRFVDSATVDVTPSTYKGMGFRMVRYRKVSMDVRSMVGGVSLPVGRVVIDHRVAPGQLMFVPQETIEGLRVPPREWQFMTTKKEPMR